MLNFQKHRLIHERINLTNYKNTLFSKKLGNKFGVKKFYDFITRLTKYE
jgi:hypothetical protein